MRAVLIYDERRPDRPPSWVEAEYESPETIEALLAAVREHCGEAVGVPFGPALPERLKELRPALAFNIAEGREGPARESVVPAVLELLGIPYTGSDAVALGISLNKAMTKRLAAGAGVPTPPFRLCDSPGQAEAAASQLDFPVLVKPNFGGSSVGIGPESIVREPGRLPDAVASCLARFRQPCLVERYVEGVDVTVGLLGNVEIEVLPPGVVKTREGIYSARAKRRHDRRVLCPCELPPGAAERLQRLAVAVYRAIGARDLARVDFILDGGGEVHFLEINPLPGLSPYYGVMPVLARAAGYSHSDLIGKIIRLALERGRSDWSIADVGLAGTASPEHQHR